jgi:hypothetical protein
LTGPQGEIHVPSCDLTSRSEKEWDIQHLHSRTKISHLLGPILSAGHRVETRNGLGLNSSPQSSRWAPSASSSNLLEPQVEAGNAELHGMYAPTARAKKVKRLADQASSVMGPDHTKPGHGLIKHARRGVLFQRLQVPFSVRSTESTEVAITRCGLRSRSCSARHGVRPSRSAGVPETASSVG